MGGLSSCSRSRYSYLNGTGVHPNCPQDVYCSKGATGFGFARVSWQVQRIGMPAAIYSLPGDELLVGMLQARVANVPAADQGIGPHMGAAFVWASGPASWMIKTTMQEAAIPSM